MNGFKFLIKPDEYDREAAEVLVDGIIGNKLYKFLLDTGAAKTTIQYDDYTSKFESKKKNVSSGVFARSSDDLISVPLIKLGPISKKNLLIARMPKNTREVRNLIGMDLLKDYCFQFLFDENKVLVKNIKRSQNKYNLQNLFLDEKFHPYIDIKFVNQIAKAVWDTGAGITIVDMNFINKHPTLFQEMGKSIGTDSTGAKMETPIFIMVAIKIGGREFTPHKVVGVDLSNVNSTIELPMDIILGYNTLSKANWLFDFPRRKWAILKLLPKK